MTLIVGNVVDVGLRGIDGALRVWAWFRPEEVGLIAPYRREWEIRQGEIEPGVDVVPGPAVVEVDCGPDAYTSVEVTVPDADSVSLKDLFEQVYAYTPRAVSEAYAERLRAEVAAAAAAGSAQAAEDAAGSFGLTASASTLAPGSSATVDVTGDGPAYGLVFGVPTGEQGPQGSRGPAGSQEIGWTDDGMPYLLEPGTGEPDTPSGEIVAAGRPDISATMDFDTRAAVDAAPTGATFRSTDGPQGAWGWRKNPNGQWSVVDGDTGWRNVISTLESKGATGVSGRLRLKRTAGLVWVSADDIQASGTVVLISEPSFQIDADNATYPGGLYNLVGDKMQRLDTATLRFTTSTACRLRDLRNYPNTKPWPTTLPGTPA